VSGGPEVQEDVETSQGCGQAVGDTEAQLSCGVEGAVAQQVGEPGLGQKALTPGAALVKPSGATEETPP